MFPIMIEPPIADWETKRQELADTLGIDASRITAHRREDGSIHIQVGEPSAKNKQYVVYETSGSEADGAPAGDQQ